MNINSRLNKRNQYKCRIKEKERVHAGIITVEGIRRYFGMKRFSEVAHVLKGVTREEQEMVTAGADSADDMIIINV